MATTASDAVIIIQLGTASSRSMIQAAWATVFSFALASAHAAGANSLICVILAAGKPVNKSLSYLLWKRPAAKKRSISSSKCGVLTLLMLSLPSNSSNLLSMPTRVKRGEGAGFRV